MTKALDRVIDACDKKINPGPLLDGIGFVTLVDRMQQDPLLKAVNSARISYDKQSEELVDKDRKLLKYLLEHGHTSPFRHSYFTFHIKAPLFVFRQWWKYQVGSGWCEIQQSTDSGTSWNEVSGRYVEMGEEFYSPAEFRTQGEGQTSEEGPLEGWTHALYAHSLQVAVRTYRRLLAGGVAKEQARLVLPASLYSEAYWTVSLQAIFHFLQERQKPSAQWEIQQYARGVRSLVEPFLPENVQECLQPR